MPNDRQSSQVNRGRSAGLATPQRKGAELDDLVRTLNSQFQLGLSKREATWSPLNSTNELYDIVYSQIQRFYYNHKPELWRAVACLRFAVRANPNLSKTERQQFLNEAFTELDNESGRKPSSRAGTPAGSRRGLSAVPRTLRIDRSSSSGSHPSTRPSTPSSSLYFTSSSNNDAFHDANVPDPGSPTDEDEDCNAPPSPTLSSRSAQRRVRANSRFQSQSAAKKRPSESSDSGASPKHTKTFQGKQPAERPPESVESIPAPLFKVPSRDMAPSLQANTSFGTVSSSQRTQPDMSRSFHSSAQTSFNKTIFSSQQTQPDTANTSFASDVYDSDMKYPKMTRTSSTTIGSLDDQDLLSVEDAAVEAQLRRESAKLEEIDHSSQEQLPTSSSTFSSFDSDGLLAAEESTPSILSPKRHPPRSDLGQSLARKTYSAQTSSTESSLFNHPSPRRDQRAIYNLQVSRTAPGYPPVSMPPRSPSTPFNEFHSRIPYFIRDIPEQNLFTDPLPEDLNDFPYFVLFICSQIATEHDIPLPMLLQGVDSNAALHNPSACLKQICANLNIPDDALKSHQKFWPASKKDFEGYTFKAQIEYNKKRSGRVFNLNTLQIQADRSCRFQRRFGSSRFLYIKVPSFEPNEKTKGSRFVKEDMKRIEKSWKSWYEREHSFLGRKWKAFHIESIKKKSRDKEDVSDKRMVMFATSGIGIDKPMSIGTMLDWFFPFHQNIDQNYCKAFARLELGLSRTIPTLLFTPSQVHFVNDMTADGTPEDVRFNDKSISSWPHQYPQDVVMNDGCSLISVGAAALVWQIVRKATNSDEPMPSAFQGRIGGAKGVWMVSGEPSSYNPDDREIWIRITQSQLKFKPHREDRKDHLNYDSHRLTFEYSNHSRRPVPSELHISFIPILVDRGVPQDVVADRITAHLNAEREELINILPKAEQAYHWIHREGPSNYGSESPRWQGAMYQSLSDKIKHMYESGFLPEEEPYLAECLYRLVKQRQLWMESKLRVPLYKSTFILGVADPLRTLAPGEVHMEFSTPFVDESNGNRFRSLENMEILVSRQPACRRSDIQKVRAVKHPGLSHLIDVVVFPSKGKYPLAGKLQGGDYDGDIFWLCWDQAIVQPFKNAPAPIESPDPVQYGIEQDRRKLSEVMDAEDLSTVNVFLRQALEFRMVPSFLGMVTNFLEKQAYRENRVYSDRLDKLCDMHDLLVDAPKQGYKFTDVDYRRTTRDILRFREAPDPSYKKAMKECEDAKDRKEKNDIDPREKSYEYNSANILDHLYFEIVRTHDVATLKLVGEYFSKGVSDDPNLQYPYRKLREHGSEAVQKELDDLLASFRIVERKWLDFTNMNMEDKPADWYNRMIDACYEKYCTIIPKRVDHPDIKPLVHPYGRPRYSIWELIRASAFYTEFAKRRSKLVWQMAGKQLAELKAGSYPGSTRVVPGIRAIMKPKPPKVARPEDDESDDEFQSALEGWTRSSI